MFALRYLLLCCFCMMGFTGYTQVVTACPENIGFERGNLDNWQTYIGSISQTGNNMPSAPRPATVSVQATPPAIGQHSLLRRGSDLDKYGHFSTNSPNGSEYVIKLGNDERQRGAERISYIINVPANAPDYSVIFSYAVVFQNPNHQYDEQPKFTAQVFDLTTNSSTSCGSFEFVAQGGIPGFEYSDVPGPGNNDRPGQLDVLYKPWSPVFVNLSEYVGHTIRLEFTTNDCSQGGHFGYAYIDFNENCSMPITGNVTCPENTELTISTLPGFFQYRWYNEDTQETLGTTASITLSPVPPVGTRIAVDLVPYPGLGCNQTLHTSVQQMTMNILDPPPDCVSVDLTDISLKVGNSSDLTYTYWLDPAATIPIRDPAHIFTTGTYYIKGQSTSGCVVVRPVNALIILVPPLRVPRPLVATYPNTVDITRGFEVDESYTYTYWRDAGATIPLTDPQHVGRKGTYYVKSITPEECQAVSPIEVDILIPDIVVPNAFSPNNDGVNDAFTILINKNVLLKHLQIFNRWGDVVFRTADITNFWTGFRDTAEVPAGVYYWVIDGVLDTKKYYRSGWVTLLR